MVFPYDRRMNGDSMNLAERDSMNLEKKDLKNLSRKKKDSKDVAKGIRSILRKTPARRCGICRCDVAECDVAERSRDVAECLGYDVAE